MVILRICTYDVDFVASELKKSTLPSSCRGYKGASGISRRRQSVLRVQTHKCWAPSSTLSGIERLPAVFSIIY